MGNYEQLKQAVSDVIKANGNQEITGAIMQNTLLSIISTVGSNATFAGIATPTTNPGTPDQNVFYIASEPGIYANFGNVKLIDQVLIFSNLINISALGAKICNISFVGNKFGGNKTIKCVCSTTYNPQENFNYILYGNGNSDVIVQMPSGEEAKNNIIQ